MPFLSQRDLSLAVRARSEKDHRNQLRAALLNPGLTADQRREIQLRLSQVGQPRVYDAATPPVPGAIQLPKTTVVEPGLDPATLQGMKKADLQALATRRDIPTSGTKAEIIARLLAA